MAKNSRKDIVISVLIIVVILLIVAFVILAMVFRNTMRKGSDSTTAPQTVSQTVQSTEESSVAGETTTKKKKNTDTIDIPQRGFLTFAADTVEQTNTVTNPEQNFCYFKVTLKLADGTVLWQSDYIAPGESSEPMKLNKPLKKGSYEKAVMLFECFALNDDGTYRQVNGANNILTILVK